MDVLNDFCLNSGQTINLSKSKVSVSPNVCRNKHRELVIIVGSNLLITWVSTWGFLFSIKEYKILTISLKKSRVGLLVGCLTPLCFLARLPWSNLFPRRSPVTLCKPCSFLLQCVIDWTGWTETSCGVTPLRKRKFIWLSGIKFVKAKSVVVWASKRPESKT